MGTHWQALGYTLSHPPSSPQPPKADSISPCYSCERHSERWWSDQSRSANPRLSWLGFRSVSQTNLTVGFSYPPLNCLIFHYFLFSPHLKMDIKILSSDKP